jgi:putative acetyltransferase
MLPKSARHLFKQLSLYAIDRDLGLKAFLQTMNFQIRQIELSDNQRLANIIRTVMPEFGASGQGFAIHDKEVDDMYTAYTKSRSAYFVCGSTTNIVGGGGIAQLEGGEEDTCELKKMYFLPEGRGKGLGQQILNQCIASARMFEYKFVYLETFKTMLLAMKLYEKNGFEKIPGPMGNTGHFACDTFYRLTL